MTGALAIYAQGAALETTEDLAEMSRAVTAAEEGAPSSGRSSSLFLNFSGKRGEYEYGREKEDLVDGEHFFLVEPKAFFLGWTCWKGGKPIGRHRWAFNRPQDAIPEEALEDHGPYNDGEGWKDTAGLGLLDLMTDIPVQVEFSSTSISGCNSIADVRMAFRDQLDAEVARKKNGATAAMLPVITTSREKFTAQGNVNWKPVFKVAGFVSRVDAGCMLHPEIPYTLQDFLAGKSPTKAHAAKLAKLAG